MPSTTHCNKDVDGRGRQDDPDGDHDVVEGDVVAVLQLEAEHDLSRQFKDGTREVPAKVKEIFFEGFMLAHI